MLKTTAPSEISSNSSYSKSALKKVVKEYNAKDIRKYVDALFKRVEKHFGDADDPSLSRGLVNRVVKECERFYADVEVRISTVTTTVYGGDVLFEWPRADIKSAFSTVGR